MNSVAVLLACVVPMLTAQTPREADLARKAKASFQEMALAISLRDYPRVAELTHPGVVDKIGGVKKYIAVLRDIYESTVRDKGRAKVTRVGEPIQFIETKSEVYFLVPFQTIFEVDTVRGELDAHALAVSIDQGKQWRFLDFNVVIPDRARDFAPDLPRAFALPDKAKIRWVELVEPKEKGRERYASKEANIELTFADYWTRLKLPDPPFKLGLSQGFKAIMLITGDEELELEALGGDILAEMKLRRAVIQEAKKLVKVAGQPALLFVVNAKENGIDKVIHLTLWNHNGVNYRLLGVSLPKFKEEFRIEYEKIIGSIRHPVKRPDINVDIAKRTDRVAFLGGLSSFDHPGANWIDKTVDDMGAAEFFDFVRFNNPRTQAWMEVRARNSRGGGDADLNEFEQYFAPRIEKSRVRRFVVPTRIGKANAVEISGVFRGLDYTVVGTVFTSEGVAVEVYFEGWAPLADTNRPAWEKAVRSFRLQSFAKPETPPAFPFRYPSIANVKEDPGLALFLRGGKRIFTSPFDVDLQSAGSDGDNALLVSPDGVSVENLVTGKRVNLGPRGAAYARAGASSRDGKLHAVATNDAVMLFDLRAGFDGQLPLRANGIDFHPDGKHLIACVEDRVVPAFPLPIYSRLELVRLDGTKSTPILAFPLSRFSHPCVSPDGKSLAVVSNKDYPRTAAMGGHLYVCDLDGSNLKQLTKEPEEIRSVSWAPDGKSLFVVRRLAKGGRGRVGFGGQSDLYQIDPTTLKSRNLTRSGKINRVWAVGDHLLLRTESAFDAQRGVFRIALGDLVKATAGRPDTGVYDPARVAQDFERALRKIIGPGELDDFVPTEKTVRAIAKEFAVQGNKHLRLEMDLEPESLNRIFPLYDFLENPSPQQRLLVFAFGAYYGEVVRKATGGEWRIDKVALGKWSPDRIDRAQPTPGIVLPFTEAHRSVHSPDDSRLLFAQDLARMKGSGVLLVYPPRHAKASLSGAKPSFHQQAIDLLDAGKVDEGLKLLGELARKRPADVRLSEEFVDYCTAAGKSAQADDFAKELVEKGSDSPRLLIHVADGLAKADPFKAGEYYRRATAKGYPAWGTLMKLGHVYDLIGNRPMAECCWRRAYRSAPDRERTELRVLLRLGPAVQPRFN